MTAVPHTPTRRPSPCVNLLSTQEIYLKRIILWYASHINICSIHNKVHDIRRVISGNSIDILAVSETWLDASYSDALI